MDTQLLQGKFDEISSNLKTQFSNMKISDDELKAALSSPDGLVSIISAKTGISQEEARTKVHDMMIALHIDDDITKNWMSKIADRVEHKYDELKGKFTH